MTTDGRQRGRYLKVERGWIGYHGNVGKKIHSFLGFTERAAGRLNRPAREFVFEDSNICMRK